MPVSAKPESCLVVIFGASGDLTKQKLIPALYDLWVDKQLPDGFAVLGISRTTMSEDRFRQRLRKFCSVAADGGDNAIWDDFAEHLYYHAADSTVVGSYKGIKNRLDQLAKVYGIGHNLLLYLSVAPQLFEPIITQLAQNEVITEERMFCTLDRSNLPWQRIVVEKPFGYDVKSSGHLNSVIGSVIPEESIYRIDHYLGKEMVQNLLVFRFANAMFEPIWNQKYIDHVQVTAAETVGVAGRGGYYDSASGGAMRDMIQSHLLQVMALVAMEPPVSMAAGDVRNEKIKVLAATRIPVANEIAEMSVRGQYGPGKVEGQAVPGYCDEDGTAVSSDVETFAAMRLYVDTWRWGGVPFYLRSGKRMAKKLTEVVVTMKHTPHCLFRQRTARTLRPNQIVINLQPDEGIRLGFVGKVPGSGMEIHDVIMDFDYVEHFQTEPPEAYATLLLDIMRGDQTLFKHRVETEHCWRIVQPIIDSWQQIPPGNVPIYAANTWGPSSSDIMMVRADRRWHNP